MNLSIILILLFSFFLLPAHSQSNCTIPNCLQCSPDPTNLTCLQCKPNFYYDREAELCAYLLPCGDGEYKNETSGLCYNCSADCENCLGPEVFRCTTCPKGAFLLVFSNLMRCLTCSGRFCDECDDVGDCISCPKGYQLNVTSGDCAPCQVSHCERCDTNITLCDECRFGWSYTISTDTCDPKTKCNLGQYNSYMDGNCTACDPSCSNCFGPGKGNCYECAYGYFFDNLSQCLPCGANCADCVNDNNYCVDCKAPLMLRGQDCVAACPGGEYYDNLERKCKSCDSTCSRCVDSPTNCQDCADKVQFKLANNTCVPICGPGKYTTFGSYDAYEDYYNQLYWQFTSDNETDITQNYGGPNCKMCQAPCVNCEYLAYLCTECPNGMSLRYSEAKCYSSCPMGSYHKFDLSSNVSYCMDCPYPCQNCSDINTCSKCFSPFVLNNGTCYYNQTKMGVCKDYEFIIDSFCLDQCPDGTETIGQLCFCEYTCKQCTYDFRTNFQIDCIQCNDPNMFSYRGQCLATCPNYTWIIDPHQNPPPQRHLQEQGRIFQPHCYDTCPSGYLRLFSNGTQICTLQCPPGSKALYGWCSIIGCPDGFFFNPLNSTNGTTNYNPNMNYTQQDFLNLFCQSCDPSCHQCNGPTVYNCLSCPQGSFLQSKQNISSQEIQTIFSTLNQGNTQMTQAYMSYFSSLGAFCNTSCPNGLVALNQLCVLCFNHCSSCQRPLVLLKDKCLFNCPSHTNYSANTNECLYDNSTGGFFLSLDLNLDGVYDDNYHVGSLNDLSLYLRINNIFDGSNQSSAVINTMECVLQINNDTTTNQTLFVRNYQYKFAEYDFFVPSVMLQPSTEYSVYCQVQLQNPLVSVNTSVDFMTFPLPQGDFDVYPVSGISLAQNFSVRYWNWQIFDSDSNTAFDLSLNYEIWLLMDNKNLCISQNFYQYGYIDVNQSFILPYVANTTQAKIMLHVYNEYTSQSYYTDLTITPQDSSVQVNYNQIIDFNTISPQNLNILLDGFTKQKSNITQNTSKNLQNNNEFLYKSINNEYYYQCDTQIDCHGKGNCVSLITDPKKKCQCFTGYAGFDCSWNSNDLQNTQDLFAQTLSYLQNQTDNNDWMSYQILNDIIGNIAKFPDAFNNSMLQQSIDLIRIVTWSGSQNDTVRTIQNLGLLMDSVKLLKFSLNNSDFVNTTSKIKGAVEDSVISIGLSFRQSALNTLAINSPNIQVKLQSLSFLGRYNAAGSNGSNQTNGSHRNLQANNLMAIMGPQLISDGTFENFTILLNDNDTTSDPSTVPGVDLSLGKVSSNFLNYHSDEFYTKMVVYSSSVLAELNSTSRYFTQILSFEIKNRTDYSTFQFFNDSYFKLRIPKIANVSSSAVYYDQASSLFTCFYYQNLSQTWQADGMYFSKEATNFIECASNHLTEFSAQLVSDESIIYDYFHSTCSDCFIDDNHGGRVKVNLGIIAGVYIIISLLLVWMVRNMYTKKYNSLSTTDGTAGIKQLQPMQMVVRGGDDEKGGVIVESMPMPVENAKGG